MKIRVEQDIPACGAKKPEVGGVYDVVTADPPEKFRRAYFIEVDGLLVGVFSSECTIVEE